MTPKVVRAGPSQVEIFDRVLDKGIVIDAWARVSVVGIELLTVDTRVVVASIATYFEHSDALAQLPNTGAPARRVFAAGASAAHLSLDGSRTAEPRLRIHGAPARLRRPSNRAPPAWSSRGSACAWRATAGGTDEGHADAIGTHLSKVRARRHGSRPPRGECGTGSCPRRGSTRRRHGAGLAA